MGSNVCLGVRGVGIYVGTQMGEIKKACIRR